MKLIRYDNHQSKDIQYNNYWSNMFRVIYLGKRWNKKRFYGIVVGCVGLGMVLSVLMPLWAWLLAIGAGLVYCGWYIFCGKK